MRAERDAAWAMPEVHVRVHIGKDMFGRVRLSVDGVALEADSLVLDGSGQKVILSVRWRDAVYYRQRINLDDVRQRERLLKKLARAGADPGMDAFATLMRYAATIERGLYKALHELERRQAARRGEAVPPPLAADVTLDVRQQRGAR